MKYIQSAGGYYYKQYKNGKKVRISKRAYNKKIGGMKNQQNQQQQNQHIQECKPKFKINERVQCNSDICFAQVDKYLEKQNDYINFKSLNLQIKEIIRNCPVEYVVKLIDESIDEEVTYMIKEKYLDKYRNPVVTPLSTINNLPDCMNDFIISAHGSECIKENSKDIENRFNKLTQKIRAVFKDKNTIKHYLDTSTKIIYALRYLCKDEIPIYIHNNKELFDDIIEYHIYLIFGSSRVFKNIKDEDYPDKINPELYTITNITEEKQKQNKDLFTQSEYDINALSKSIKILSNADEKQILIINYKEKQIKEWYNDYKKMYNEKFYLNFIKKNNPQNILHDSPRYGSKNKIELLNMENVIEKLFENIEDSQLNRIHFFTFLKYIKDKNVSINKNDLESVKYDEVFEIYKILLKGLHNIVNNKDGIYELNSEYFLPESDEDFNNKMNHVKNFIPQAKNQFQDAIKDTWKTLKDILASYVRKSHVKLLRDIILYDNQYVIMKCDAGCTAYEYDEFWTWALLNSKVKDIRTFLKIRMKTKDLNGKPTVREDYLKDYCIYKNMVPNIMLQCSEKLERPNFNARGVFKLPLQFEEGEERFIMNDNWKDGDPNARWEININGLKEQTADGKVLHFYTNIKRDPNNRSELGSTNLEKIIKIIRDNYGPYTPFRIFIRACRSGQCISIDKLKQNWRLDGGLKKKKKVKKGGLKKKVKTKKAKVTAKKVRKSKKN